MNEQGSLFTEEELADASFLLLSSSCIARYTRIAQEKAAKIQLNEKLGIFTVDGLISRAETLWKQIQQTTQRDVPEIELALILAGLAPIPNPRVNELLTQIKLDSGLSMRWISALANNLLRRGPAE